MNINALEQIIELRRTTQKEISENIGITQAAFSHALKRQDFKVSTLELIAKFLQVPVSIFFDDFSQDSNFEASVNQLNLTFEKLKTYCLLTKEEETEIPKAINDLRSSYIKKIIGNGNFVNVGTQNNINNAGAELEAMKL